ncbi:hypothetical protein L226DRAFT_570993 [Lentinus tigrinus ALCF2SS1-7]|uniref:F-box domain-containing protein n=1 Tax=Lentinus tigrinus ALCF2SS1-6 TaxID=1328759 RepID=A0A5C2S805_9APHY|nr:hypothetical protein L227DRAFT_600966 [Lentinus tigrinus ALCF2SS1-6]RPD74696.1 hypothetical protein L226DRAFT_570993 [Lentinus tigrinus ALCF2SS1-7]
MSCSLCRLPFTPSTHSVAPRWPPQGVLTDKQLLYMKHAFGVGQYVFGLAVDLVNMDNNNFIINNSPMIVNIVWETAGKTFIAFHPHCAIILRHHLGYSDNAPQNFIELALLEQIVGPTMDGVHAGRLKDINYETVLGGGDQKRVDIESLWSKEGDERPDFDWLTWQRRGLDWTAVRPDVFPRFRPKVAPTRISSLGPIPKSTEDIITTQPLDILHVLLPYLDPRSFVSLMSTCRTLRHHALTTFQSQARTQVLRLGWAVPTKMEYAGFVKRNPPASSPPTPTTPTSTQEPGKAPGEASPGPAKTAPTNAPDLSLVTMAHAKHSPVDGDWYLYLSQVHRTQAMRSRRWVWALAEELTRVYRKKRAEGPYEDVVDADGERTKSPAWMEFAKMVKEQLAMRAMITAPTGPNGKAMSW